MEEKSVSTLNLVVWSDGAYKPSTEQGGIGVVWTIDGKIVKTFSKGYKNPGRLTNQVMEMMAAMVALNAIKKPVNSVELITDSMYVVGTMTKNWKRKANLKLWKLFDSIVAKVKSNTPVKFTHTKGHADDEFNNLCDKLADEASKEFII